MREANERKTTNGTKKHKSLKSIGPSSSFETTRSSLENYTMFTPEKIVYFHSKNNYSFNFNCNKATRYCAIAHKDPTPLIHNFGLIVYQMRNREKPKNSSILKEIGVWTKRKSLKQITVVEWKWRIRLMRCANIRKSSQDEQQNQTTATTKINYIKKFMYLLKHKTY